VGSEFEPRVGHRQTVSGESGLFFCGLVTVAHAPGYTEKTCLLKDGVWHSYFFKELAMKMPGILERDAKPMVIFPAISF
jgi:hypothetical protein